MSRKTFCDECKTELAQDNGGRVTLDMATSFPKKIRIPHLDADLCNECFEKFCRYLDDAIHKSGIKVERR